VSHIKQDVYGKNRNDVMEIMKDTGYMRFGYLNPVAGSRSVMLQENEWVHRESRKRVLGTWRRMPKVSDLARFHNFQDVLLAFTEYRLI